MKHFFLSLFAFVAVATYSQNPDRIRFYYDGAGNQIHRTLCINCGTFRMANETPKEVTALKDEDLLKFSTTDVISYYPNPVKEELYLKWELNNENKVSTIQLFSLSGQLLHTYTDMEKENTKNIPFQDYPQGTYLVLLNYSNGEQKSITILKK